MTAQDSSGRIPAWLCALLAALVGLAGTTARATEPPSKGLAIVGARVYPSPDAAPIEDGVVVARAGRIVAVGPRSKVAVPAAARAIDAHGAVLVAGFWNSHVHLMTDNVLNAATLEAGALQTALEDMFTRRGFTAIFDIASSTDNTLALRRRVQAGEVAGPLILTVGDSFFPENGTPIYVRDYLKAHGWGDEEVSTPGQAAARAAHQLERGTDGVKVFAGAIVGGKIGVLPMRVDIARAVVDEAHRRGKPAFAHPSNLEGIEVAVESGVDILAHTTALNGDAPGWPPALITRLRAHHMALIPTLTLFEVEARRAGEDADVLDREIRRATGELRDYAAADGQILFGTDAGYTDVFDTTEEYRLMSAVLDWRSILRSLTTAPAERFGFAARKGRIAAGMDADLVLLDSDPAQDPVAFAHVRDTIRAGQVIWGADR